MSVVLSFARLMLSGVIVSLPILSIAAIPASFESGVGAPGITSTDAKPSLATSLPTTHTTDEIQESNTAPLIRRALNIAVLMPSDASPFLPVLKIVGNGLIAASRTSENPANILLIEATDTVSLDEQIDAAVFAGADVVVGPLQKDLVNELAAKQSLPIPVVSLNLIPEKEQTAPENLLMMSVSSEMEAVAVAKMAVQAMPETTVEGFAPRAVILKFEGDWEDRISAAYEKALSAAGISYEVRTVDMEKLSDLQKDFEAKLSPEDEKTFTYRLQKIQTDSTISSEVIRTARIKAVKNERRSLIAMSEPPYQAAFLAMDAMAAGLVRNRLPLRMRVWATSSINPGDPKTSSTATALAYDLNNVVFTECPLIVRYDAAGFEARFKTSMPYSVAAKRLFALGADAYAVAERSARHLPIENIAGETGVLTLNREHSAQVQRTPATVLIQNGVLNAVDNSFVENKNGIPLFVPNEEMQPGNAVDNGQASDAVPAAQQKNSNDAE